MNTFISEKLQKQTNLASFIELLFEKIENEITINKLSSKMGLSYANHREVVIIKTNLLSDTEHTIEDVLMNFDNLYNTTIVDINTEFHEEGVEIDNIINLPDIHTMCQIFIVGETSPPNKMDDIDEMRSKLNAVGRNLHIVHKL